MHAALWFRPTSPSNLAFSVLPHPAALPEEQLLAACELKRTRRGGPGGQHRNKVETAVVITHLPSGVSAEANERRSQAENREIAIQRLRVRLALAIRRPAEPLAGEPSSEMESLWARYKRGRRVAVSAGNPDFPAVLAIVLDHLLAAGFEPAEAGRNLEVSSSQLLKLVQLEPAAWAWLQEQRQRAGLKPLHAR